LKTIPLYDETTLLKQIAKGEEASFRMLYDKYRAKIYTIALRITGIESSAEDVVQEVFIKVWNNRKTLPEIDNFNSWLNTITRRHIFNNLRKLANEEKFLRHLLAQKPAAPDAMESVAYNELQALLNKAVSELTPQQKKVYLLSRAEGLSHAEIAKALNLSHETVKSYMKDALREIRSFLEKNEKTLITVVSILLATRI
jgi:RNA polymerase sigma-70 factor (ECF subfamily)